jgi:hypothetical protein
MKKYRADSCSKIPAIAMPQKTQITARKPAVIPRVKFFFGSARNMARFTDMISASRKDQPNIFDYLLFCTNSVAKLFSFIQALPNKAGEYHTPLRTNAEIPAAKTAS